MGGVCSLVLVGAAENIYIQFYIHSVLSLRCRNTLHSNVSVAKASSIGADSLIRRSVIGRNCSIGERVTITNCILLDDVAVQSGCVLDQSLLCNGAKILSGAPRLERCIVGRQVVAFLQKKTIFLK